jgi:hypothetical protein
MARVGFGRGLRRGREREENEWQIDPQDTKQAFVAGSHLAVARIEETLIHHPKGRS